MSTTPNDVERATLSPVLEELLIKQRTAWFRWGGTGDDAVREAAVKAHRALREHLAAMEAERLELIESLRSTCEGWARERTEARSSSLRDSERTPLQQQNTDDANRVMAVALAVLAAKVDAPLFNPSSVDDAPAQFHAWVMNVMRIVGERLAVRDAVSALSEETPE